MSETTLLDLMLTPERKRIEALLGLVDDRIVNSAIETAATMRRRGLINEVESFKTQAVDGCIEAIYWKGEAEILVTFL